VDPPTTVNPKVIAGRYAVEHELGRGATATVHLARDRRTFEQVAIKVLRPELAQSVGADRFLREIRVTADLQHLHILSVLDSGADDGLLYCVLPYMEGGTLRDRLMRDKQLPMDEAVGIARTIALALAYAHGRGLIHRDVKPENILFSRGEAYLGDFGIARLLYETDAERTTSTGVVRGTPAYMSPEQASGTTSLDGRSDLYSLGCVLYEMLAGIAPFTGPIQRVAGARHVRGRPPSLQAFRPDVTPRLQLIIERTLAMAPADRYPSAAALSGALAGAHEPMPPSGLKRFRWGRIALAAGVLLALAALGMWLAGLEP
jgi:eukaryotic-like serine/threonine-protein kinase